MKAQSGVAHVAAKRASSTPRSRSRRLVATTRRSWASWKTGPLKVPKGLQKSSPCATPLSSPASRLLGVASPSERPQICSASQSRRSMRVASSLSGSRASMIATSSTAPSSSLSRSRTSPRSPSAATMSVSTFRPLRASNSSIQKSRLRSGPRGSRSARVRSHARPASGSVRNALATTTSSGSWVGSNGGPRCAASERMTASGTTSSSISTQASVTITPSTKSRRKPMTSMASRSAPISAASFPASFPPAYSAHRNKCSRTARGLTTARIMPPGGSRSVSAAKSTVCRSELPSPAATRSSVRAWLAAPAQIAPRASMATRTSLSASRARASLGEGGSSTAKATSRREDSSETRAKTASFPAISGTSSASRPRSSSRRSCRWARREFARSSSQRPATSMSSKAARVEPGSRSIRSSAVD